MTINKTQINTVEKTYDVATNEFVNYKVTTNENVVWFVPLNSENTDHETIQEWIADGGTVIDNGGGE
jgi:membrane-bound lytic murein transglycosylase MltF